MSDPRLYRTALIPVLFALVLLAFSLQNRPRPLTTTLAPDAFAGERAFERAYASRSGLAARFPQRRPGSPGDERLAGVVAAQFREAGGFRVRTNVYDGETIDGRRSLRTVIAERPGTVDERIVVVAHRDAAGPRAEAELSATAVLLELARVFGAPRQTQRTLTLVSTSGGSGGAAGAAALADQLRGPFAGVLVLGDLASRNFRGPLLAPWSNHLGASPQRLRRTLQEALRQETGSDARQPRALSQFARFAMPATYGEQGVLLARGLPAVTLSIGGDRPPPAQAPISRERLEALGRVALRTVTALDVAPRGQPVTPQPSSSDLVTSRKVLPGWAVRLFTGTLLLAPLIVVVDALAALRRAREPILSWLRWTLVGALPLVVTVLFAIALGAVGLLAATPRAPVTPQALGVQAPALLAVAFVLLLGWFWLRPALLRITQAGGDRSSCAAGVCVLLVAVLTTVVVWVGNPYAAVMLAPALHIWLFALATELRMHRVLRVALVVLAIAPVAIVAAVVARALGLGPVEAAWQALLLVAGGHVTTLSLLLWSLLGGSAAAALIVAARGGAPDRGPDLPITVRGPRSYAGPGSLGGTESALRG
ncbi:MAG: M28 family peptidase [Solirubrobacteraceae bacterium]